MNARRGDGKETLQVGLGGRASIDLRVGMDERQILSLSFGEFSGWARRERHGARFLIDCVQRTMETSMSIRYIMEFGEEDRGMCRYPRRWSVREMVRAPRRPCTYP